MSVGRDSWDDKPASALRTDPVRDPGQQSSTVRPEATWPAEGSAGQIVGVVLFLFGLAVLLATWQRAGSSDGPDRLIWVLFGLAAAGGSVAVAVMVVRLRTMTYVMEDSQLVISTVGRRLTIPLDDIVDITFRPRDLIDITGYERFWPGFYDSMRATSEGYWRSIATTPPSERVRIRLRNGLTIAISPERPVLFVAALEKFRRSAGAPVGWPVSSALEHSTGEDVVLAVPAESPAGPASPRAQRSAGVFDRIRRNSPAAIAVFRERIVRGDLVASNLLALNLIALIVLTTITSWRGDAVNAPLAVHWDARGEPTWFVREDGIWIFEGIWIYPLTAAAIMAINSALATLAAAAGKMAEARLLLSASFVAILLLLVGLWRTTGATLPVLG
ncbi:hypothetical protein BH23CHL2_BH23CHL2_10200 [soil metagenome]